MIAIGISLGAHILFAMGAEGFSAASKQTKPLDPVVEISRIDTPGSSLPNGAGNASMTSVARAAQPDLGPNYGLEAGVPMKLDVPKSSPTQQSPTNTAQQTQTPSTPLHGAAQSNLGSNPGQTAPYQPPQNSQPKPQQDTTQWTPPPSAPSQASLQGNEGKPRSRGANRKAFPIQTFEPNVENSLMGAGVSNSVDVSVDVAADGSHSERIVRSSGSSEVDARVMDALKRWKWDPAAENGQAIASTENFKFTFRAK